MRLAIAMEHSKIGKTVAGMASSENGSSRAHAEGKSVLREEKYSRARGRAARVRVLRGRMSRPLSVFWRKDHFRPLEQELVYGDRVQSVVGPALIGPVLNIMTRRRFGVLSEGHLKVSIVVQVLLCVE